MAVLLSLGVAAAFLGAALASCVALFAEVIDARLSRAMLILGSLGAVCYGYALLSLLFQFLVAVPTYIV